MKFSGKVGFYFEDVEVREDVYGPMIVEKQYIGDVKKDRRSFQDSGNKNPSFTVNNQISILANLYAINNWTSIKYVEWKGIKFEVTSVEVGYPRLNLTIGGVWNGKTPKETSDEIDSDTDIS